MGETSKRVAGAGGASVLSFGAQERLADWLRDADCAGWLVWEEDNRGWVTGLESSWGMWLQWQDGRKTLVLDGRYAERGRALLEGTPVELVVRGTDEHDAWTKTVRGRLGVSSGLRQREIAWLGKVLPRAEIVPMADPLVELRREKTVAECQQVHAAQKRVDDRLMPLLEQELRTGVTEQQLAWRIEQALREPGDAELSFPVIVAFAEHTARPHHAPTNRALRVNEPVLVDCGVRLGGLCSDMTRCWWYGPDIDPEYAAIYAAVERAVAAGLEEYRVGGDVALADEAARGALGEWETHFCHSLGHGVGRVVHEAPSISGKSTAKFTANEIVTVEPGVYVPERWGVRLEELVQITPAGPKVLSQMPMALRAWPVKS